jgi:hypothetical protein
VIGDSIVSNIMSDYEGPVIKIDLKHRQQKFSGKTKGLLIQEGQLYKSDDTGNQHVVQE